MKKTGKELKNLSALSAKIVGILSSNDLPCLENHLQITIDTCRGALLSESEQIANFGWFISEAANAWTRYLGAFGQIQAGNYYEGWCDLERLEISLQDLSRNKIGNWEGLKLGFLVNQVKALQVLYPYRIFLSPEFIVGYRTCTICGAKDDPWEGCTHEVGRLYSGKICHRTVHELKLVSVSLVDRPLQKYSVAFLGGRDGETVDQYDYSPIRFVIERLRSPLDGFSVRMTWAYHPHRLFGHIIEADPCPCESGATYRDCCAAKPGVLRRHIEIDFEKEPPSGLPTYELIGYERSV